MSHNSEELTDRRDTPIAASPACQTDAKASNLARQQTASLSFWPDPRLSRRLGGQIAEGGILIPDPSQSGFVYRPTSRRLRSQCFRASTKEPRACTERVIPLSNDELS